MSAGGQNYVDQTKILSTKLKINKSVLVIMYFSPEVLPGWMSTTPYDVLLPGSSYEADVQIWSDDTFHGNS